MQGGNIGKLNVNEEYYIVRITRNQSKTDTRNKKKGRMIKEMSVTETAAG